MNYLSNVDKNGEKTPVIPTGVILLFVLVVSITAILLYPAKSIEKIALAQDKPELVTYFYLMNLLKNKPNDGELRTALIRQEIALHKWSEADIQIKRLAEDPMYVVKASILNFYMNFNMYFNMGQSDKKKQLFILLQNQIKNISSLSINQDQLINLGDAALGLGLPDVALIFYKQKIGVNDPVTLRKFGRTALGAGQYVQSANYYFDAVLHEKKLETKRSDVIEGLKALQQGSEFYEIIRRVKSLPENIIDDKAMLRFLVELCISAGRTDMAKNYALLMLEFDRKGKQ